MTQECSPPETHVPPRRRRRCRVTPKFDSVDCRVTDFIVKTSVICTLCMSIAAVQNERQPRNTATIRPENLKEMDPESIIREASVAVGAFG